MDNDNLTVEEAAKYLRIGRATLFDLIAREEAPPSFRIGNRRLFPRRQLQAWIEERTHANH